MKAAQKFFSEDKERGFEARVRSRRSLLRPVSHLARQMADEYARLLATQQQLEKEADGKISFFGQSVNETIRTCLINSMAKRADKLKADFKVPDKRYAIHANLLIFVSRSTRRVSSAVDSGT